VYVAHEPVKCPACTIIHRPVSSIHSRVQIKIPRDHFLRSILVISSRGCP